jgi:Icc-related predicted phosphoesterase
MKLLCITDLHGDHDVLNYILADAGAVDLVLLGGDITNFGTPNAAESVVRQIQRSGVEVLAVAGNCDSESIDQRLAELDVSLFGRGVVRGPIGFHGVSAMPPWHGSMYELTETQIAEALAQGDAPIASLQQRILLTHTPPHDTELDLTRRDEHVGSASVRSFIELRQPSLVVCGHIHEARGLQRLGSTLAVTCGPAYRGCYAIADLASEVQVELCKAG